MQDWMVSTGYSGERVQGTACAEVWKRKPALCPQRTSRGFRIWEELRIGEVESLGGAFGLYPQESRGKPVKGFTVKKGSTVRTDWKGRTGSW